MRQLRHLSEYLLGDQVDAAVLRPQVDLALKPGGADLQAHDCIAIRSGTGDSATSTASAATAMVGRGHGAVGAAAPDVAVPADALLDPASTAAAAAASSSAGAASSTAATGRFRCAGVWITAATATSLAASSAAPLVAWSSS